MVLQIQLVFTLAIQSAKCILKARLNQFWVENWYEIENKIKYTEFSIPLNCSSEMSCARQNQMFSSSNFG